MTRRTCVLALLAVTVCLVAPTPATAEKVTPAGDGADVRVVVDGIAATFLDVWVHDLIAAQWTHDTIAAQWTADTIAAAPKPWRTPTGPADPPGVGGGTVGDCTGFSIPDYIIQRESGGNPSAYNPSGAYGCAQTLLSHYTTGNCRGLDPYTIEGQRACVDILSAGGTNLQPWAQTR